ncbi:sulfur carrier protein ThiS [Desmospora profundinema]|uniref:Sulfur carrier protein n=1 Tax=Desmospora profundinema TaxID=1571184 RepID=A0ABU1IJY9_9BACL|nr:sulfur carrier protein ThiS [Desmospora profundinema]MDR6225006.1 sulfur carrier protein [Desmospora profundinema]
MTIEVNGQEMTVPDQIKTVEALLEHLELEMRIVVVEQNRRVLERDDHKHASLQEGDRLEIVQFVGGG